MGQHNGVRFVGRDRGADHQLIVTLPVDRKNNPNVTYWQKRRLKLKGRKHYRRVKTALRFEHLGRDPKDITLLVYEKTVQFV